MTGGHRRRRPAIGGKGKGKGKVQNWTWRESRVHSVMGLVRAHEGEYRRWNGAWGPVAPNAVTPSSEDTTEVWQLLTQPDVGGLDPDSPLIAHHQLQLHPATSAAPGTLQVARQMAMSSSGSTIVRTAVGPGVGQPLAAPSFEARDVFIVSLPEIFLRQSSSTAADTYEQWLQCEVIIGKRPPRGSVGRAWLARA